MFIISEAVDTITTTQLIRDNETIVSSGGSFELGFFSPGKTPIANASGVLKITNPGILVLFHGTSNMIWSSNTSRSVQNPIAQLLDSGNFVVRNANDDNPQNFLWQSFDYPGDTLLPDMKLGRNLLTGLDWYLSSWESINDPAQGDYTFRMDTRGYPQLIVSNVTTETYRTGPWNGLRFSGTLNLKQNTIFEFNFTFNEEEVYYGYELLNSAVISR
ncbi:unnamed protein product [Camellia sinensis]